MKEPLEVPIVENPERPATTILVVDDNEQNLELIEILLRGKGYQVVAAANGAEALATARQAPPDLIISDILMPVMDGFALCREWKKDERLRRIPFVFYTATYTDERDREFALGLGADQFIVKPQEAVLFLQMILEVIQQARSPSAAPAQPAGGAPTRLPGEMSEEEEARHLKKYNRVLIRKLESKMVQLRRANRTLEHDFADHLRVAEALRDSETRYRRLFEAAKDGILILDAESGMVVDVNPFLIELLGFSRDQFLGKAVWDLGFLKDILPNRANFLKLQEEKYIRYEDLPLETADGRKVHVEFVSNVYDVDHHKVIQCNVRDITERKRAEEALHASQQIIEGIMNAMPVRVFWKDRNLVYLGCNAALARDAGFADPKDVIGKDDFQMGWRDRAELYRNDDRQVIESGCAKLLIEESLTTPDGSVITILTSKTPLRGSKGEIVGMLGTYMDITERKRAERQILEGAAKAEKMMDGTIKAMSSALEIRDPYTAGHERRVAQLSSAIAREMQLPEARAEGVRITAYLHDIGKIAVPAEILSKPGRISSFEFGIIKTHPQCGYDILKQIEFIWPVAVATLQHHERLNGSGYPNGLKGDQIILEARILAVADVVEAMAAHRPYRPALGIDRALAEIMANKGILYDADAVTACVKLFKEKGFTYEVQDAARVIA